MDNIIKKIIIIRHIKAVLLEALVKIWNFPYYFSIYRFLLANHSITLSASEQKNKVTQETTHKYIQFDARFTSNKKGFAFFHDLFVKRHRKILTLAIKKHRAKLEQMILENEDYNEIVKQSQKLDKYINIAMQEILAKASSKD